MKKLAKKIALIMLVVAIIPVISILFTGCGETSNSYNIILTKATMPSILAGMDSVASENETYAYIERGATYSGIADVEKFHNVGPFNPKVNNNTLTTQQVALMQDTIEQIVARDENAKFTIYVTDYDALTGWAIAYGAGLNDDDFKVVMVEDGSGLYDAFANAYVNGKTTAQSAYEAFQATITSAQAAIEEIKTTGNYSWSNYPMCFGLATLPTGCLRLQDTGILKASIDANAALSGSKLYEAIKTNPTDKTVKAMNMKTGTAGGTCSALNEEQFSTYLTLALGRTNQEVTEALLLRTTANNQPVSSNKLVFCGSRALYYNFNLVEDITDFDELIAYDDLATGTTLQQYIHSAFIETDYNATISKLNSEVDAAYTDEQKEEQKIYAFNLYMEYRNVFDMTFDVYGDKFDILYKGHPRELVYGNGSDWTSGNYPIASTGRSYEKVMFSLVKYYHATDASGTRMGVLPGGVSIDTFAYLGKSFALGGLESSTYSSYPTHIPTEFIIGNNANTIASYNMTTTRYINGTMFDSENKVTSFFNRGAMLQLLGKTAELKTWIEATYKVADGSQYGITKGGFLGKYTTGATPVLKEVSRNIVYNYVDGATENATKEIKNGALTSTYIIANPTRANFTFAGWFTTDNYATGTEFVPAIYNNASETTINVYAKWNAV